MLSLADLLAGAALVSLTAYCLFGGADFGGGVWDLLATGERRDRQRSLIAHAIGPIWEANHVWLILVVVLLFTCFPAAFARLSVVLHIPLTIMLVGIVLRGSAFTFRSYGGDAGRSGQPWGRTFAIASTVTPVLLGVCVGAVASGRVRAPAPGSTIAEAYVAPWLTPFALGVGVMTLALFAFLAAVYLTVEAPDELLREDFRRRALGAAAAVFAAAFGTLVLSGGQAPLVRAGLTASAWALPLHLATGVAAVAAIWALWTRRYRAARVAAAAQVSFILWGWALAQYPYIVPPDLTIRGAAAPRVTLALTAAALVLGAAVLVPSLVYLFRVFKSQSGEPGRVGPHAHGG